MSKSREYKVPIVCFIFRRDLRLEDHKPLQTALDYAKENDAVVLPMFIFSKSQVGNTAPVKSYRSIACLIQSLKELDAELYKKYKTHLSIFRSEASDKNIDVLKNISKKHEIYAIFETKDYTPFANERSENIQEYCEANEIEYQLIEYLYLVNPDEMKIKLGKIYQKFTPFYNAVSKLKIPTPMGYVKGPFLGGKASREIGNSSLKSMEKEIFRSSASVTKDRRSPERSSKGSKTVVSKKEAQSRAFIGGRKEGLKFLKNLKSIKNYDEVRNQMPLSTSNLSVHHHYGTVSIRESYVAAQKLVNSGAKQMKEFQRQLFWRDFYGALCGNFKKFYGKKYGDLLELVKERPKLSQKKQELYDAWCNGTTGIDIVDAGINQLNATGFCHNRSRLILSSILVKTWGVNWQYGAGYFAEKLVDYDFTQNTMNWLFIAGGFPFSEAPFRKVNPERQAKLLDSEGVYRKRWLK
jgi:deoxyribodipyrimidine photo-lyase